VGVCTQMYALLLIDRSVCSHAYGERDSERERE
jgi:hypothetical protein